jgi:hypothetical protein
VVEFVKQDCIDDINELLDSWSPVTARRILTKLSTADLLELQVAIEISIADAQQRSSTEEDG